MERPVLRYEKIDFLGEGQVKTRYEVLTKIIHEMQYIHTVNTPKKR